MTLQLRQSSRLQRAIDDRAVLHPTRTQDCRMSRFHKMLNQSVWNQTRRTVLERDGWRCVRCGKAGRLEVDHIRPLEKYKDCDDPYDTAGLQTLCRGCHFKKSSGELNRRPLTPQAVAWNQLIQEGIR